MTTHKTAIGSFNENHLSYDQLRPEFTDKIVNQFLSDLNLTTENGAKFNHSKIILELAAGTGKFTKKLVKAGWGDGDNLKVVEPSSGMLTTFKENFPQIDSKLGSSYEIPLPDDSVDAIIVAQGFHWFSDEASLIEMNRVLKKSQGTGYLGLIWNYDYPYPAQILSHDDTNFTILFDNVPEQKQENTLSVIENINDPKTSPYQASMEFFKDKVWAEKVAKYAYGFDIDVPQYRHNKWRETLNKFENKYFSPIITEGFLLKYDSIPIDSLYPYWKTRSYITALDSSQQLIVEQNINKLSKEFTTKKDFISGSILQRAMGSHSVVTKALRLLPK